MTDSYVPMEIAEDWEVVREQYSGLEEAGAVKFFDPTALIADKDLLLTANVESDINDESLWELFTAADVPDTWAMLKEKVPSSVFGLLQESVTPGYIYYAMDQARFAHGQQYDHLVWRDWLPPHLAERLPDRQPGDTRTPQEIFDAFFRWIHSDTEVAYNINSRRGWARLKVPPEEAVFAITTSYLNGSSIAINEAMLASDALGAAMATDSEVHHQMLAFKYRRAKGNAAAITNQTPRLRRVILPDERLKRDYVTLNVFQYLVSDASLAALSLEQCLRYREASREALQKLRSYLVEVDSEIEANFWDVEIETKVQKVINKKIRPEARKVTEELASIRTKLFGSLAATLTTGSIPSLVVAVYPGLHPAMSLLFGASAITGGSVAIGVKDITDSIAASRSTKRNGLSYLLKLNR